MASKFKLSEIVARLRIVPDRKKNDEAEKEVKDGFGRMEGMAKKVGLAIAAAFAADKILDWGKALFRAAADAEIPWRRLEQTIDNAGGNFGLLERRIKLAARAMQDTTRIGDEEFATTLNRLINFTGDINLALANMPLVADAAARFFEGDLKRASDVVGRSLAGNSESLREIGIMAKSAEDGLRILAERSKGAAENELKTLDGQIAALKNDMGDMAEAAGGVLIALGRLVSGAGDNEEFFRHWRLGIQGITEKLERLSEAEEDRRKRQRSALAEDELKDMRAAGVNVDALVGGVATPSAEVVKKRNEQLDKEVSLLAEGFKLQTLKNADILRAMKLEADYQKQLRSSNLELEERNRIEKRLQQLREITGHHVGFGDVSPFMGAGPPDPRLALGQIGQGIRGAGDVDPLPILFEDSVDRMKERLADLQDAATNTAFGISGAFQDSFSILIDEFGNLGEAATSLFRGVAGAMIGGVSQYAGAKVKENVASSIEELAKGLAATANPFLSHTAAGHFAASAKHAGAAALWGVLAGGAGAAQSAVAGGGRGGFSGGVPGGSVDADARRFDFERGPQTIIYIDGFDPGNPVHVQLIGQGVKNAAATDSSIDIRPRSAA